MIVIKPSENADSRTCDVSKVSKVELLKASQDHIKDVKKGMGYFASMMIQAGKNHDHTKLEYLTAFHNDFKNGFAFGHQSWWYMHQKMERHHLKESQHVQHDVNLIDILEMVVDGVMAGLARSGQYRKEEIPDALLRKAFDNTIKLLLDNVKVEE